MFDTQTLQMALVGLEAERQKIETAMAAIRKQLGVRSSRAAAPTISQEPTAAESKRNLSSAARKRIGDAQKLRWRKFRKAQEPAVAAKKASVKKAAPKKAAVKGVAPKVAPKKAFPKKKMSAERKAALVANLAKARAAKAAKKTEGEAVPS
jgi:hypothetical protein